VASHGSANGQAAAQPLNEENSAAGAKSNIFQEMSNFAQHQRGLTDTNLLTHTERVKTWRAKKWQRNGCGKMDVPGVSWREWFVPPVVIPAALTIVLIGWLVYQVQSGAWATG